MTCFYYGNWYATLWAIVWFFLSAVFYKRKNVLIFSATILSSLILFFFLQIIDLFWSYFVLQLWAVFLWIMFGILINILESRYFWYVGKEHNKEYWSATYWLSLNILNFIIMLTSSFLLKNFGTQSTLVLFSLLMISTLFIYKNFDKKIAKLELINDNK